MIVTTLKRHGVDPMTVFSHILDLHCFQGISPGTRFDARVVIDWRKQPALSNKQRALLHSTRKFANISICTQFRTTGGAVSPV